MSRGSTSHLGRRVATAGRPVRGVDAEAEPSAAVQKVARRDDRPEGGTARCGPERTGEARVRP